MNGSDHRLSAHAYLGSSLAKLDEAEIARNRAGGSSDRKTDAAVRFAATVARERGHVGDADLAAVKLAGFSEAQVVEIVALVALNALTNFVDVVAETDSDFPVIRAAQAA